MRTAAGAGVAAKDEVAVAEVARGVAGEKHLPAYSRLSRKPKRNTDSRKKQNMDLTNMRPVSSSNS